MGPFDGDLLSADDETIAAALDHAVVPPLLAALAAVVDDRSLIPDHLRPSAAMVGDATNGLSDRQQGEARRLALDALRRLRDRGGADVRPLEEGELVPLLAFLSGGRDATGYRELVREELALGEDPRAPGWHIADLAPGRSFRVVVIGAGMSGLVAAHRLHQAGIDVVVIEKDDDVGGTWLENSYPGCRVDVSNHFYSYSFRQRADWPEHFSSQTVLLDYFRSVADDLGIRPFIRFGTEVTALTLDDETMTWTVTVAGPEGVSELSAHAVVSAVGQLNRPNVPHIDGADRFAGAAFHSARWDHRVDLAAKRVAVIGTGASAAQFIPPVSEVASALTVFQRTPAWLVPTPEYQEAVPPGALWLFRNVPGYASWYRFWIFWQNVEGMMPAAKVDPSWEGDGSSVSAINEMVRLMLQAYLHAELAPRPDLLAKVIPDHPPFAKRFIRDDGAWARTLMRANVDLVTEGIEAITPQGVRTADGDVHEVDVIIYGTGFKASEFLMPMTVTGTRGESLHERWRGDARAHLGITVPGFPNLFMLYGPNTNIVANGSITYFSECAARYVVDCVRALLTAGARAMDVKPAVHDAYNERVDAENSRMAWGVSSVNSWYKNATGRTAQNWPFSLLEYWRLTREVDPDDFELL